MGIKKVLLICAGFVALALGAAGASAPAILAVVGVSVSAHILLLKKEESGGQT